MKPTLKLGTQQNFTSYCACLYKSLSDSIAPVVNAAMECFDSLVKLYGPHIEFRDENVRDLILQTILRLCFVMQKNNARMSRRATSQFASKRTVRFFRNLTPSPLF